jgi:hypothetical protein
MSTFSEILDAASDLSADEQATLLEILRRRLAEQNRQMLVLDVDEARTEFANGDARPASVDEIMNEASGEA